MRWNYGNTIQKLYIVISMPGCVTKQMKKYKHEISKRPQHASYPSAPKKYGTVKQKPIKIDDSKLADPEGITAYRK